MRMCARSYDNADVYLLDDPLSAVDSHVGRALFEQVIRGPVLRSKTVLLVTNALQYLPQSDHVVWLEGGHIRAEGTFSQLQEQGAWGVVGLCPHRAVGPGAESIAAAAWAQPCYVGVVAIGVSCLQYAQAVVLYRIHQAVAPCTGLNIAELVHHAEDEEEAKKEKEDEEAANRKDPAKAAAAATKDAKTAADKVAAGKAMDNKVTLTRQATDANRNLTGIEVRESGSISASVIKLYFFVSRSRRDVVWCGWCVAM